MATVTLEPEFGYVILVFVASAFVLVWKGIQVRDRHVAAQMPGSARSGAHPEASVAPSVASGALRVVSTPLASPCGLPWPRRALLTPPRTLQVGRARKRLGVKYPTMYLPEDHKHAKEFNCIQRAHQNTLENYTQFLGLLLFAGLKYPTLAALAGVVNLLGRIVYALGYYTGDPKMRARGWFSYLGTIALAGLSVATALSLLGHI